MKRFRQGSPRVDRARLGFFSHEGTKVFGEGVLGFLSTDSRMTDFEGIARFWNRQAPERQGFWKGMARFSITDYTDDADFGGALLGFV